MKEQEWTNECICCENPLFEDSTMGLGEVYRRCLSCGEAWVGEYVEAEEEPKTKKGND